MDTIKEQAKHMEELLGHPVDVEAKLEHLHLEGEDLLMIYVEIGGMPPGAGMRYIQQVKESLKSRLPQGKVMFAPMYSGKPVVKFDVQKQGNV